MSDYRVLVTGSRDWSSPFTITEALNGIYRSVSSPLVVVHGQCDPLNPDTGRRIPWERAQKLGRAADFLGADWHAHLWAAISKSCRMRVREEMHPAAWYPDGRFDASAGFRRNAEMVGFGADEALAFLAPCAKPGCREPRPHYSHGTEHCATMAAQAGIPVRRITGDG